MCQELLPSKVAEPLKPHEVPTRSWQKIGTDLYSIGKENYLIYKNVMAGRLAASGYAERWPSGATWSEYRSGKVDDSFISEKNSNTDQRAKNRRIKIIFGVN